MNRFDAEAQEYRFDLSQLDVVELERQARAMQARAMAELIGGAARWVVARLRRQPAGQTA